MSNILIRAENITKTYNLGSGDLPILKGISLEISRGEGICILGASGAGKSTLLHILGTLDRPTKGEVYFENKNLFLMKDESLALFRNESMGFVFQFHHLLSEFSAIENIMMPCRIAGESKKAAQEKAEHLLEFVGLADRRNHFSNQLSGGELQRVAIARALVRRPQILFADEPTGNLDSQNGEMIQKLFFDLKEKMGLALVVVTHDLNFAKFFGKTLRIVDGRWA